MNIYKTFWCRYDRSNLDSSFLVVLGINDSLNSNTVIPTCRFQVFLCLFLEYILLKKKKFKKEREGGNNNTLIMYIYISALR